MTNTSTTSPDLQSEAEAVHLLDNWFDAIEVGLRERVREFIQAMIESELETALARPRYGRRPTVDVEKGDGPKGISGHRHGHPSRSLIGTFGRVEIAVPRARLDSAEGKTTELEEFGAASLPAANQAGRFADRRRLSCRDQYASGAAGTLGGLWRRGQQRYGEPRVAEGERRLGCLECPLVGRGADHPPDPGWHRGAGPA